MSPVLLLFDSRLEARKQQCRQMECYFGKVLSMPKQNRLFLHHVIQCPGFLEMLLRVPYTWKAGTK